MRYLVLKLNEITDNFLFNEKCEKKISEMTIPL